MIIVRGLRHAGVIVRNAGLFVLALALLQQDAQSQQEFSFDSSIYHDAHTAQFVALARARHQGRALHLAGYQANTFTRVEGRIGRSRFAPGLTVFAYETAARVHWAYPGNVKVDVKGARMRAPRIPGLSSRGQVAAFWEDIFGREPWFVPGAIGDEIQLMGIPEEEAIHPLASGAERFYRYAITDSIELVLPNRTVRAVALRVEPRLADPTVDRFIPESVDSIPASFSPRLSRLIDSVRTANPKDPRAARLIDWQYIVDSLRTVRPGDSVIVVRRPARSDHYAPTLVSGDVWLDADSLDVVRMSVAFIGERIWDDDPDAPTLVNLEADLEYGLHEGKYWLPLRQILSANFTYRYLPGVKLPASAVTTFSDFSLDEVETDFSFSVDLPSGVSGRRFGSWGCPSAWEFDEVVSGDCGKNAVTRLIRDDVNGTSWEISLPPRDSLLNFDFDEEFEFTADLAGERFLNERLNTLARISEQVPGQATPGGRLVADWIKVYDVFGFNRVQGPSLGFGYAWDPGIDFTTLLASGRFGFGDERVMGQLTWQRESPHGKLQAKAFRAMDRVEPEVVGSGVGGALRTLFMGRDEADYYMALGGELSYAGYAGGLKGFRFGVAGERQRSVALVTGSRLNDFFFGSGAFPRNPSIIDGDYARVFVAKEGRVGPVKVEVGADGLASTSRRAGRFWGGTEVWFTNGAKWLGQFRTRAGVVGGDSLPQLSFRVGGRSSVRGHDYGFRSGTTFWSGQLDLEWVVNQWWSPVAFVDVGNAGAVRDPLVGVGIGASFLSGLVRLDLSKGMNPSRAVIFDLLFQIPAL